VGRRFTEAELLAADPIWILELTLAGQVYRFATENVEIEDLTLNETYRYLGTLSDVDFTSSVSFFEGDLDLPSAGVSVVFDEDVAELIANGADLGSAEAELSLWLAGQNYDDRQTVVSGKATTGEYGADGDPVKFTIEPQWLETANSIPGPAAFMSEDTFSNLDESAEGMFYPVIIGKPGADARWAGSPAYVLNTSTELLLIADGVVDATTVKIEDSEGNTVTGKTVLNATDSLGQAYSYVDISGFYAAGRSYFTTWNDGSTTPGSGGGGIPLAFDKRPEDAGGAAPGSYLTNAGDVIRYLLLRSGVPIDEGRTVAACEQIQDISFNGYIGERTDCLEILKNEILPLLPVSLRAGVNGVYPVVWKYWATKADELTKLTADRDIFRNGGVKYEGNEIANEFLIKWRHDAKTNKLSKTSTLTGDPSVEVGGVVRDGAFQQQNSAVSRNIYTVNSYSRYGNRSKTVNAKMIGEAKDAYRVLAWKSQAQANRHKSVTYQAPFKYAWLEPGNVVSVTDTDIHFNNQLMLVRSIEWGQESIILDLLMVPNLFTDTIPTG
jgi:hypothetical protein